MECKQVQARSPCPECGDDRGTVVRSGPHWRVNCEGCGRYRYFASKVEIEGKMAGQKPLTNQPGGGVLFHKTNATGQQPTLEGGVNIDGEEYRLAGWERTSKNGNPFISLKISKVGDNSWRNKLTNGGVPPQHTGTKDDNDIPW